MAEEVKKEIVHSSYIKWLYELDKNSGPTAGGKAASLAEMFNKDFPVPPAFVVTTKAYWHLVENIKDQINELLDSIDVDRTLELEQKAKKIRELIINEEVPQDLQEEIAEAYEDLSVDKKLLENAKSDALNILQASKEPAFVAVRSSATTEDLADASFAGQQETYLNVKGSTDLIEKVKVVFASLFTARAIFYRKKKGFSKEKFSLAVVVQKMINAEKSGVIFSNNPVKTNDNVIIEAVFGLGEGIVSGKIKPDNYEVNRDLEIVEKNIAEKKIALIRNSQGQTETVKLTEKSKEQVITDSMIKQLANHAIKLEEFYKKPQDIEFAVDQEEIYIVQSRPITTQAKEAETEIKGEELISGLAASPGVGSGKVKIIHDLDELDKIEQGDVLVTEMTNPDMVVTMQKSAAIVTDEGGLTCHAAIVSREMGIPSIVGTGNATEVLKDGEEVTVDGFKGKVYAGKAETVKAEVNPVVETKTKIKVIVDLPEAAERAAKAKTEGIGLMRLEGIIASSGKHPIMFLKEKNTEDYTNILTNGISKISEPFKEIWIRTSDIRSDEFSNLEGAPKEIEANPMLGDHGIRFSLKNKEILKAELTAIKNCAEKYPDKKFGFMLPQIISVEEFEQTKKLAEELGLQNVKKGIMVETPSSCFIIKHLLKAGAEFASFGTNDLTQYTLAVDRGNEQVQELFNEMHPAVLNAMKRVIRTCKEMKVECSICGQAGSRKDMVKFLVENGIDSISVNADAAKEISEYVAELEKQQPEKSEEQSTEEKQPEIEEEPEESLEEDKGEQIEKAFEQEKQEAKEEQEESSEELENKEEDKSNESENKSEDEEPTTDLQKEEDNKIEQEIQEIDRKVEQEAREVVEDMREQQIKKAFEQEKEQAQKPEEKQPETEEEKEPAKSEEKPEGTENEKESSEKDEKTDDEKPATDLQNKQDDDEPEPEPQPEPPPTPQPEEPEPKPEPEIPEPIKAKKPDVPSYVEGNLGTKQAIKQLFGTNISEPQEPPKPLRPEPPTSPLSTGPPPLNFPNLNFLDTKMPEQTEQNTQEQIQENTENIAEESNDDEDEVLDIF